MPVPETSVSSVHQHRDRKLRHARYGINTGTGGAGTDFRTGTGHCGKFVTLSIPAPDTSISSVHQYRYRTLRTLRCHITTGAGHFGKFGTTSIPVQAVPVCTCAPEPVRVSAQHQHRYRYNIDTGVGHFSKIGTSIRYRTLRYVSHGINPILSHRDVIPWSFGSRQHSKAHTPRSPSIFQHAR